MRILSEEEIKLIDPTTPIPPDLKSSFFAVRAKLHIRINGVETPLASQEASDLDRLLRSCMLEYLNCECIESKKHGYGVSDNTAQTFTSNNFKFGAMERSDNKYRTQVFMFPLEQLLFKPKLEELEIKAKPGYLYVACAISDYCSSRVLAEEDYQTYQQKIRAEEMRSEGFVEIKKQQKEDYVPKEIPKWRGSVADIEHAINGREIYSTNVSDIRYSILETPFEFPPGFVRETACHLKKEQAHIKIVEKFIKLISSDNSKSVQEIEEAQEDKNLLNTSMFPEAEPNYIGPDKNWRYSDDPFFVQSILLARLIGGSMWNYALGNIEQYLGLEIDLS